MADLTLQKNTDLGASLPLDTTELEDLTSDDKWLLWYDGNPVVCENILKMFKTYIVKIKNHLSDNSKIGDDIKSIRDDPAKAGDNDVNQLYFKLYTPSRHEITIKKDQTIGLFQEVSIDSGKGELKDVSKTDGIGKFLSDPLGADTKFNIGIKYGSHYTTPQGCVYFTRESNEYYFTINNPGLNKSGGNIEYDDLAEYFNTRGNVKNNKTLSGDKDVLFGGSRKKRKSKSKKPRKAKSQKKPKPKPKRSKKSKRKKSSKK